MELQWKRPYSELENINNLENESPNYFEINEEDDHEDGKSDKNLTNVWEIAEMSERQEYRVLKPAKNSSCEMISCVSSSSMWDVACLDMEQINKTAGEYSTHMKFVPLESKSPTHQIHT